MKTEIEIQVSIVQPLKGVVYALQSGKGKNFENVQGQVASDTDLHFLGKIWVNAIQNNEEPDFSGDLVQGSKLSRFLYIGIGTYAGQPGSIWARRLKIPFVGITSEMINQIETSQNLLLATAVPGIGKDGGPNCATVKPFAGWQVKKKIV